MEPTTTAYPVFEANQVLTNRHLNELFEYLDQQSRLTRTTLTGIGIVCGLELRRAGQAGRSIAITRGCGVTSQGYLCRLPEELELVSFRADYRLPDEIAYPTFKDSGGTQYPLWELFADGEDNTTALEASAGFLDDKIVLLFVELKQQGLRNCSPNNCDDKGAEVEVRLKPLLIRRVDADRVLSAAHELAGATTSADIHDAMVEKLALPDIRLGRFDVPNTQPVRSGAIYTAYLRVFGASSLAGRTRQALDALYAAFRPLLPGYTSNPFADFAARFGFLDIAPESITQTLFLPYYLDLFSLLIAAYDECRWKGSEVLCACVPSEELFPRHLFLGAAAPEQVAQPGRYRDVFRASPALHDCHALAEEFRQLFERLVAICVRFTDQPSLPAPGLLGGVDSQIRITPSVRGAAVARKAIPYYLVLDGQPSLQDLWSPEKTRRRRGNQNLGYRASEYVPAAPDFVLEPLRFDLEGNNFLRIEGHLGKASTRVLQTLATLKSRYRLPCDFILLRTGAYDSRQHQTITLPEAQFDDLQALYAAFRGHLLRVLCEAAILFYETPLKEFLRIPVKIKKLPAGEHIPQNPLIRTVAPEFRYSSSTVGAWYETHLQAIQSRPYPDIDQRNVDAAAIEQIYSTLFLQTTPLAAAVRPHAAIIFYLGKLHATVAEQLSNLGIGDFRNRYQDLVSLVRYIREHPPANRDAAAAELIRQLLEHVDSLLMSCQLESLLAIHDQYIRRREQYLRSQFLANFLQEHPGIQSGCGVPLGGTFVLVCHQAPASQSVPEAPSNVDVESAPTAPSPPTDLRADPAPRLLELSARTLVPDAPVTGAMSLRWMEAVNRIVRDPRLSGNSDVQTLVKVVSDRLQTNGGEESRFPDDALAIIQHTVSRLGNGTVIADFFLPYRIGTGVGAAQFVLPAPLPGFTVTMGCASPEGGVAVSIAASGGLPPYQVKVDGGNYIPLANPLLLQSGDHTLSIRDAAGIESVAQLVTAPTPITFADPVYECTADGTSYTALVSISGGTPPYAVDGATLAAAQFKTGSIASGTESRLRVTDSRQCSATILLSHTCPVPAGPPLPCGGIARRRGYRFWLPEPTRTRQYSMVRLGDPRFVFQYPDGTAEVNISGEFRQILSDSLQTLPGRLNQAFGEVVNRWLEQVNRVIADKTGNERWMRLSYEGKAGGFGTLWIEYFECLNFNIRLDWNYQLGQEEQKLRVEYEPQRTNMAADGAAEGQFKVSVPAFDPVRIDLNTAAAPEVALCTGLAELSISISKTVSGLSAKLGAKLSREAGIVSWLWEVEGGIPMLTNTPNPTIKFASASPLQRAIRITAFTKDGCRIIRDDTLNLRG